MTGLRRRIVVRDVGPRDGLQSIAQVMPTQAKLAWIGAMFHAGMREIEVASFVPPSLLPQMADAEAVTKAVRSSFPGLKAVVLAPNLRGVQRAAEAGATVIMVPVSASETHSRANVRKTRGEQVEMVADIIQWTKAEAPQVQIEAGLATAFGCSKEGEIPETDVLKLAEMLSATGVHKVSLADTLGYANPSKVRRLVKAVIQLVGVKRFGNLHLHDTLGSALANVMAGLESGATGFDSALGGLGGCPYAPGSVGNVATEDLVYLLEEEGLDTGIDLDLLLKARETLQQSLPGERLHGRVAAAGIPKTYYMRRAALTSDGEAR